ncbi:surface-adhesin E family protein [Pseudorhodoferax sp. Leaf274]|uniref:surface-adhesin E family protein n=1 Tax=Pseudorhodoferax sp. Leaf274 TaxID=1736318 RepID=UPI000703A309|nr:surface-adhesin E family protein [Pseudorhodoferax sp. Leaf274]KQP49695.1 hypothetical protein ASF44_03665 [Pseudorhodoferax sp. Leaf274]
MHKMSALTYGLTVLAFSCAPVATAAPLWFTVMGDLTEPTADTVELNVGELSFRGEKKAMDLRVNLAAQRTMASGEKYQSYVSLIEIDCLASAIVHVHQTRFEQAGWRGASSFQNFPEIRPMAFGGLVPNPKDTILRAACQVR